MKEIRLLNIIYLEMFFPSLSFAFCLYGVFGIVVTVCLHLGHFETWCTGRTNFEYFV